MGVNLVSYFKGSQTYIPQLSCLIDLSAPPPHQHDFNPKGTVLNYSQPKCYVKLNIGNVIILSELAHIFLFFYL